MNQPFRTILIVTGAVLAGAFLLLGGMYIGRASWSPTGFVPGSMMGGGFLTGSPFNYQRGQGMMGAYGQADPVTPYDGYGMTGFGMMGPGMMGSSGMMGGFQTGGLFAGEPLTLSDARAALESYLTRLGNEDLELGEIMIFDNHAYAQIIEKSTGIGAFEVLVDPATGAVSPEHGPNMMWNLKYSPMGGFGMGAMMGGFGGQGMMGSQVPTEPTADMPVSLEEAVAAAQSYLDTYLPGTQADDHADPFYGYYTLHILRDGDVVGMLSVNGYSSQVFPHTWHGDFIEMATEGHD